MTATIQPNTIMVERSDVQQRLSDYKSCIKFYLSEVNLPIYFIENSEFDLESDPDFIEFNKSERFNIIRINALQEKEKGKGYQEFYALDRAVDEFVKESYLIKVTGR